MIDDKRFAELLMSVARLERKVDFLFKSLNLTYEETALPFQAEVEALLQRGEKVEALKLLLQRQDATMQEATIIVEQVEKQLRS